MAVRIIPRTAECTCCHEMLEYTTSDVSHGYEFKEISVFNPQNSTQGVRPYIQKHEYWTITCPNCKSKVIVKRFLVSTEQKWVTA